MTIRTFEGNELLKLADRMRSFFVGRDEVVWRAADVYSSAAQTIAANTYTALTFNAIHQDTDSMFAIGSPTRLTVKVGGWYVCSGHCLLAGLVGGTTGAERLIAIRVNNSAVAVNNYGALPSVGGVLPNIYMSIARVIFLNSNDYVELFVLHSSAVTIDTVITNYSPILAVSRYP